MLPQLPAIPLQTTSSSSDSAQNVNRLFPVGQNVSATVVAVSRDQIQPEVFKLKLEVNNRLIQMGVFQALPVGQKINVIRQNDGQIQITPQPAQTGNTASTQTSNTQNLPQQAQQTANNAATRADLGIQLKLAQAGDTLKLPTDTRVTAAVISSRPVYPPSTPSGQSAQPNTASATITPQQMVVTPQQTTASPLQPSATLQQAPAPVIQPSNPGTTTSQQVTAQAVQPNVPSVTTSAQPQSSATPPPANLQTSTSQTTITTGNQSTPAAPASTTTSNTIQNPATSQQAAPSTNQGASVTTTQQAAPSTNLGASVTTAQQSPAPTPQAQQPSISDKTNPAPQQAQQSATPVRTGPPIHHILSLALPDGSKVEVQSPRPIPQGTQLQLASNGSQNIQVLRIQEPPLTLNSALDKPAIQEILRNTLPIQQPLATAFNQLAQATTTEANQTSQIGSVVRSMLNLFGVRPGSSEAPSQIRQNVEFGGLNTERQLSQGRNASPLDMKAQLQQLQQLSDNLPAEQRERFDQIIKGLQSRVTTQQINSLHQWRELPDGGFERVLQLDLPIKQGETWENLELRLSREGGTNSAGEMVSVWRVRLHFDLEEQGGVDAEIRLTDGHEISTLFWCEHKNTAEKLRERSEEFAEKLRMCGFNNSEITWHEGQAPRQDQVVHKQLVDLHT
ncbi:flagellar hook-length control protein FliK [Neptuniibacter sp. QD37_6]|uniref:flagellar hook-length control protein FliK n=1 Tax=Neptuniibacter sp. QD37_6 TaxID=3398210 RepID=UPI0039F521EB